MFLPIDNVPRDYAWGSRTAISNLLGLSPSGAPEAELWLGSHPACPSRVRDIDGPSTHAQTLDTYLAQTGTPPLSFLLKVLAADSPLSLQVHPTTAQAQAGFARETQAGIAVDAPHRIYRDESAKPELIMALDDGFEALSGFRDVAKTITVLRSFAVAAEASGDPTGAAALTDFVGHIDRDGLAHAVRFALTSPDVQVAVSAVVGVARRGPQGVDSREAETVRWLSDAFGTDPGVLIGLLLHRVTLKPGEALFLGAGNLHSYLRGVGIEIMSASDNVVRGGLTTKYVDVDELLRVARWEPVAVPLWPGVTEAPGVVAFHPPVDGFTLYALAQPGEGSVIDAQGPGIALGLTTAVTLRGAHGRVTLDRGEAVYISKDEFPLMASGTGRAVLATG